MECGWRNCAAVAGPPSPLNPSSPVPAMVVMIPLLGSMRRTIARTSSPVKISEKPHDRSELTIENSATKAMAPRGVFG